ncbi:hypothetical protein B0J13DRAFT_526265 [Dactylonectria estremocensis]|uniref:Uncharacterized protein n=1 Tax=Dactylonectria estremocensis TaxID=1079267 RepID=A0A9P9ERD8_9HYPO|nr:hypothetical protein B0J13DRAFT_526265 [Dactylonectria estremocensis]
MDLWLAVYAYWALMILALCSFTAWAFLGDEEKSWLVPIILIETWIFMYLSLKILTFIHDQHPHLFASAAATHLFLTSTRQGAVYMALATTIWLTLLVFGGVGLFMGTFMWLADPPVTTHWHVALVSFFWIGYLSLVAHLLNVWVISIRLAAFGPRGGIALN